MREIIDSGGVRAVLGDVLPCLAMVVVEGCIIALTITASTAMAQGMSPYVFVVYTNFLGSIILLPYSFFWDRDSRSQEPFLSMAFLVRVSILGFLGITISQNLGFLGLSYSSPIVACGMANQVPAMSFVLGIILRTTKFDWRSSSTRAQLIGTFISLSGAVTLTLYKGPSIKNHQSPSMASFLSLPRRLLVFSSPHENWILGCILYAASSLTVTIWNIFQVETLRMCTQVMKIVSLYSLFGTLQSAVLALFLERDPDAWKLGFNFELLVIVLTAIFGSLIRSNVQIWCTKLKGPHFVPIFKPFGIPYASTFGCVLFAETFHYGSMIAAFICGVGYYIVLWGQIKDEETHKSDHHRQSGNKISMTYDETKVPLLLQKDAADDDSQV